MGLLTIVNSMVCWRVEKLLVSDTYGHGMDLIDKAKSKKKVIMIMKKSYDDVIIQSIIAFFMISYSSLGNGILAIQ